MCLQHTSMLAGDGTLASGKRAMAATDVVGFTCN
jgi:hypothetical protein